MIIVIQTLVFFRQSIFDAIHNLLKPYIRYVALSLKGFSDNCADEESEEVFADFDDEKGVVFFPPVYAQRYAAVVDCLLDERWRGKLEKVVDLGYHDTSFIKHLKNIPGVHSILGVDLDMVILKCTTDFMGSNMPKTMKIMLYKGNAADPDYRLIGCDAVVAIEMIEHMLPYDLERLIHTIFGFIKPRLAVITTPNGDFNVLFKALESNGLRRLDHFFEWSREQFHDWCSNIVTRYPEYTVTCKGIGPGPQGTEHLGCCSQLALFVSKDYHKQLEFDVNSLSLVSDSIAVEKHTLEWKESTTDTETDYSSTDLTSLDERSIMTFDSYASIQTCTDKMLQCDLDLEISKHYLMYNDEDLYNVLIPRKKYINRIYIIEDISSRLNCSMSQVRKYSKDTLELIDKNKDDPLVHMKDVTKEVNELIDEIDFNYPTTENTETIWNNINWGYEAPYWNQYYRLVKEITPEMEPDELRIITVISEEVGRILKRTSNMKNKKKNVVIPISRIMNLVQHITENESNLREILEWNDYEISGDALLYPRPIVNCSNDDWDDDNLTHV